jgi:uncharacterized delta-60 repeat protein
LEGRTLLNAGALDPTFGAGGKVLTDFTGSLDSSAQVVLRQTDGKLVVAGPAGNGVSSEIAMARYNADGSPDNSFGVGGQVTTAVGSDFTGPGGAALLPDGKILVAGSETNPQNAFVLARYGPDGKPDPSFGTGGILVAPLPSVNGSVNQPVGLVVQPDGRLLVAAPASGIINARGFQFPISGFVLARYNADGSADNGFGTGGQVADIEQGGLPIHALALQSDSKILLALYESSGIGNVDKLVVRRLNPGGDPDTSFGNSGTFTSSLSNFIDPPALTIQSDRKIVIGGGFELARLNPDGTVDSSFGNSGLVVTSFGANPIPTPAHLITQPDGKLLVAGGRANATGSTFVLARYSMSGTLDTSFGMAGIQTTGFGPGDSAANDLLLAGTQIVVAGRVGVGGTHDFGLARYNADGSLDTGFGTGGKVTTDFTGPLDSHVGAAVLQADGKVVVVGGASNGVSASFALARYNPDGTLDSHFGNGGQILAHPGPDPFNEATAVALQPGGNIVVAGTSLVYGGQAANTVLVRYTPDGRLDPSFGKAGTVIVPSANVVVRLIVLPDGKLMLGGPGHTLSRFNADGSVDTTFANNGQADLSVGDLVGLVVQSDGSIVSAGSGFTVARNAPDGPPDPNFGPGRMDGSTSAQFMGGSFQVSGIALQANGKSVAVGTASSFTDIGGGATNGQQTLQFGLARFRTDGGLDGGFGTGGQTTVSFGSGFFSTSSPVIEPAATLAIQPNGSLVVAGRVPDNGGADFGLAVLRPDGTLDPTFGSGGIVTTDFGGADNVPAAVVLQGDGNIVVAGSAGNNGRHSFALARYVGNALSDNGQFVAGLYQDLLNRRPDPGAAGFQQSVDAARDQDLTPTAAVVVTSTEARSDLITHYYSQYLGRMPSPAEIGPFVAALQQGVTPEQVQAIIAGSAEYFQHQGGTNDAWLNALYKNVLGRPPDAASQGLLDAVNQGLPRDQAAAFLLGTPEYRSRLVTQVYAADLARMAGPAEINIWLPLLSQPSAGPGQPSADERFVTAVLASAEYFQRQGNTALGWIDGLYGDVLDRTPDPTALANIDGTLFFAAATARQADALAVATSGEYRTNLVAGYYKQLLGRTGSADEINFWVGQLQSGVRDEQVIAAFVASDEYFRNAGGTNAAWLDRAYRDLLGRSRDPQDLGFLNALAGGARRLQVAAAIVTSTEYRQRLVRQFYSTFLGRTGSDAEINGWIPAFEQGARDEDVAVAILSSGEYYHRPHSA